MPCKMCMKSIVYNDKIRVAYDQSFVRFFVNAINDAVLTGFIK